MAAAPASGASKWVCLARMYKKDTKLTIASERLPKMPGASVDPLFPIVDLTVEQVEGIDLSPIQPKM